MAEVVTAAGAPKTVYATAPETTLPDDVVAAAGAAPDAAEYLTVVEAVNDILQVLKNVGIGK